MKLENKSKDKNKEETKNPINDRIIINTEEINVCIFSNQIPEEPIKSVMV